MSEKVYGGKFFPLAPVGKHLLLEITKEEPNMVSLGGVLLAPERKEYIIRAMIEAVGDEVTIPVKKGDFVELSVQKFPAITDENGVSRFQLVHEEMIIGVYAHK